MSWYICGLSQPGMWTGLFPGSMDMLYIKSTNLGKTETGDHAASQIKLSHQRLAAQKQAL